MESYYLKNGTLVRIASHKTIAGAKCWSTKYALWSGNGKCNIYILENGLVIAMRVNGKWVCAETDARRRARLDE